jgi:hypothetical protein
VLLASSGESGVSSTVFVLAFFWLGLAVGRRTLRLLGVAQDGSTLERGIVGAALGVGILQFVPYALGAAGLLGITSLRWSLGIVALAMIPDVVAVAKQGSRVLEQATNVQNIPERWLIAWGVVLTPGLVVIAFMALTPTIDPDGLTYHLTAPKRWLAGGSLSYLPTYFPTNGPMGAEMLFTMALVFAGDIAAKLLHFSLGLAGAGAIYAAGRRYWGRTVSALAVTLYLFGPGGLGTVLGFAYVEGATAFAAAASILAWMIWFQERRAGWLRCSSLLAGIAVSFKIVAALFPLALGALTFLALWDQSGRRKDALVTVLQKLAGLVPFVAAPVVPWLVRSLIVTGNPVFPLFATLIPSRDLSPALASRYEQFNRYFLWGTTVGAEWSLERRQAILVVVAIGILLAGALVAVRFRGWMARSFVVVLSATALAQLFAAGLYGRYWMPFLCVLPLTFVGLFERPLSTRWSRSLVVVVTLLASMMQARRAFALVDGDVHGLVRTAVGLDEPREFLLRHMPLLPIYEQGNRDLPAAAGVLLNGYCGGFYLDRTTFCADFPQEALRFANWTDFVSDLRRLGITHVIAARELATGGPLPPPERSVAYNAHSGRNHELIARLLRSHGRLLVAAADEGLYELDLRSLE